MPLTHPPTGVAGAAPVFEDDEMAARDRNLTNAEFQIFCDFYAEFQRATSLVEEAAVCDAMADWYEELAITGNAELWRDLGVTKRKRAAKPVPQPT